MTRSDRLPDFLSAIQVTMAFIM